MFLISLGHFIRKQSSNPHSSEVTIEGTVSSIDISIFSTHSVRGASFSSVASMGIYTAEILKAANWSLESVFQRLYYKLTDNPSYGRAVLSQHSAINNIIDMGD